jgi:transcriptional regulator with XRE-family HTH domain
VEFDHLPEGMKLRLARVARGWTLFDLGKRADISPPRLSEFECGRRMLPPEKLERIKAALAEEREVANVGA